MHQWHENAIIKNKAFIAGDMRIPIRGRYKQEERKSRMYLLRLIILRRIIRETGLKLIGNLQTQTLHPRQIFPMTDHQGNNFIKYLS